MRFVLAPLLVVFLATSNLLTRESPRVFEELVGVVTYRYEKERQRINQSQGKRTMEWRLVEFGKDATSAAPNAK